jgi:hypothetical protein
MKERCPENNRTSYRKPKNTSNKIRLILKSPVARIALVSDQGEALMFSKLLLCMIGLSNSIVKPAKIESF